MEKSRRVFQRKLDEFNDQEITPLNISDQKYRKQLSDMKNSKKTRKKTESYESDEDYNEEELPRKQVHCIISDESSIEHIFKKNNEIELKKEDLIYQFNEGIKIIDDEIIENEKKMDFLNKEIIKNDSIKRENFFKSERPRSMDGRLSKSPIKLIDLKKNPLSLGLKGVISKPFLDSKRNEPKELEQKIQRAIEKGNKILNEKCGFQLNSYKSILKPETLKIIEEQQNKRKNSNLNNIENNSMNWYSIK